MEIDFFLFCQSFCYYLNLFHICVIVNRLYQHRSIKFIDNKTRFICRFPFLLRNYPLIFVINIENRRFSHFAISSLKGKKSRIRSKRIIVTKMIILITRYYKSCFIDSFFFSIEDIVIIYILFLLLSHSIGIAYE
jgi:hypothetical protein